ELPGRRDLEIVPAADIRAPRRMGVDIAACDRDGDMGKQRLAVFEVIVFFVVAQADGRQRELVGREGIVCRDGGGKEAVADDAMGLYGGRHGERGQNGQRAGTNYRGHGILQREGKTSAEIADVAYTSLRRRPAARAAHGDDAATMPARRSHSPHGRPGTPSTPSAA